MNEQFISLTPKAPKVNCTLFWYYVLKRLRSNKLPIKQLIVDVVVADLVVAVAVLVGEQGGDAAGDQQQDTEPHPKQQQQIKGRLY